jgi:hypothetical protein
MLNNWVLYSKRTTVFHFIHVLIFFVCICVCVGNHMCMPLSLALFISIMKMEVLRSFRSLEVS